MTVRVRAAVGEGDNDGVLVLPIGRVKVGAGVPVALSGIGAIVEGGYAEEQAARKIRTVGMHRQIKRFLV